MRKNTLEKKIETEEVEIMCKTNFAFPLLCRLVSNNEERFRKRISFFRQPLSILWDDLDKMNNGNKKLYCILVICMLYKGSFSRSIFEIDSAESVKITKLMHSCGIHQNLSKKKLEDCAFSAIGSYFVKDSNSFRFIIDALEETVGKHFFTFNPRTMLFYCDFSFIKDRIKVHSDENLHGNVDENIVIIKEDDLCQAYLETLYNRFSNELAHERFSNLLKSRLFENKKFVRIFRTHVKGEHRRMGSTTFVSKEIGPNGILNYMYWSRLDNLFKMDQLVSVSKTVKEIDTNDAIIRVIRL